MRDRAIQRILLTTEEVVDEWEIFERWDVSLATSRSVLGLIRITVWFQEFLKEILPLHVSVCLNITADHRR